MLKPEILAPAGSYEAVVAAVRSGADAVYLGANEMNARRNAENFDEAGLREAVGYCRIRGVKVYLTLNILISNRELDRAMAIVKSAVLSGIDGIIVQDLGLARLIRVAFPCLPLHASTQMTVMSPSALEPLKKLGFSRAVAARELNRVELLALCEEARRLDMEIEVFVHGALCMSVSGQCLMSAVLGGRSGNRGLCAGPCRLPFSAPEGSGYDLSLKDLSLLDYLGELEKMGVASLKIEGRMKRPEYVAAAVSAVRSALYDEELDARLRDSLEGVFSRSGFTSGYYKGRLSPDMFGIRTKEAAAAANLVLPIIHEYYRSERHSVPIDIYAKITDSQVSVSFFDGEHTVTVEGCAPERAQSRALDKETVAAYLKKLGSTPYLPRNIRIDLEAGLYLRGADLNALRREATDRLNEARRQPKLSEIREYSKSRERYYPSAKPSIMAFFSDASKIPENLKGVAAAILPIEQPPAVLAEGIALVADIPRGMAEETVKERLRVYKNAGCKAAVCSNIAAVRLALAQGFKVIGGAGLNCYNSESASVLKEMGLAAAVMSPELKISEITSMDTALPKGIFAYGRLPLMLTRNCPIKNGISCAECGRKSFLTDRMGAQFPVRCRAGYCEIFNSVPLVLSDRPEETDGLDFLLLSFLDESPDEISKIINAYRYGSLTPTGGYTRGLYYRKVE